MPAFEPVAHCPEQGEHIRLRPLVDTLSYHGGHEKAPAGEAGAW